LALQLKAMGHEPAIFAYFGLSGSLIDWQGIPVYPNNKDDYGVENVKMVYEHFKADCIITLVDIWILGKMPDDLKWFPWVPIDHEPTPPGVQGMLIDHPGIYKPIAMARYGEREMKRIGVDCFYVPHMIDCKLYSPNEEMRKSNRRTVGWENKFVIGQVGTNVRERKNWTASFLALQKLYRKHRDIMMYCHTDAFEKRGRDLQLLREALMIKDITTFPPLVNLRCVGVDPLAMAGMYNSLDVYLSPSKGEGFGIPVIEAQACGVPVIVANNTAQPELCGGGWLIKNMRPEWDEQSSWEGNADPNEIYDHLNQAYHEKKTGKLAKRKMAARELAVQYDIGPVMEKYWVPTLKEIEEMIKMTAEENKERRKKLKEAIRGKVPEVH